MATPTTEAIKDVTVKLVLNDLLGQFGDIDWICRVLKKRPRVFEAAQALRDQLAKHSTD